MILSVNCLLAPKGRTRVLDAERKLPPEGLYAMSTAVTKRSSGWKPEFGECDVYWVHDGHVNEYLRFFVYTVEVIPDVVRGVDSFGQ
jgi:hypothetical protein